MNNFRKFIDYSLQAALYDEKSPKKMGVGEKM